MSNYVQSAYQIVDHEYDVVVVGAGGSFFQSIISLLSKGEKEHVNDSQRFMTKFFQHNLLGLLDAFAPPPHPYHY